MKYSTKVSLEIKMDEFNKCAKSLVNKKELKIAMRDTLRYCWHGIVDGYDGNLGWKYFFYRELVESGIIKLTDYGKSIYGDIKI